MFKIDKRSKETAARCGILETRHGEIRTPFFMPIATKGSVKNLSSDDMKYLQAQILLSNIYHLIFRPGAELIKKAGGLHNFMNWTYPILTDSGGFQIFSLSGVKRRSGESLVKLNEEGVEFQSYIDGSNYFLTPEKCIEIQRDFGVDIAMCLDRCVANPCGYNEARKAMELTVKWAMRCKNFYLSNLMGGKSSLTSESRLKSDRKTSMLFGIVQGALYKDLRLQSARDLIKIGFDGYAIGGLAVGEDNKEMYGVLNYLCEKLPEERPRYLMGVGTPKDIVEAVKRGIDMFDCAIPTREARHGRSYKFIDNRIKKSGERDVDLNNNFYEVINIHNKKFKEDFSAIDELCRCAACGGGYTKAYLRHLFSINENLAKRLVTIHNLYFYLELMRRIRYNIIIDFL